MRIYTKRQRLRRNPRDKKILETQRRHQREKARIFLANIIQPEQFRDLEEEQFIQSQYAKESGSAHKNAVKVEHPSCQGYTLRPVTKEWNCRETSPMFFGYESQNKSELWEVDFEIKLFGVKDSETTREAILFSLYDITQSSDIACYVKQNFIKIEEVYEIDAERMRRLSRKLTQRSEKETKKNNTYLAARYQKELNLLRTEGAINVKSKIKVSCLQKIYSQKGIRPPYRIGSGGQGEYLSPSIDLSFGVAGLEEQECKYLQMLLQKSVTSAVLEKSISKYIGKEIIVSLTHTPEARFLLNNYVLEKDTPRGRKSEARTLTFNTAEVISRDKLHRTESNKSLGDGSSPRFEQSQYIHPVFLRREQTHILGKADTSSPVFWGQWTRQFFPDFTHQISKIKPITSHPSFGERATLPEESILYPDKQVLDNFAFDVTRESPVYIGMRAVTKKPRPLLPQDKIGYDADQEPLDEDEIFPFRWKKKCHNSEEEKSEVNQNYEQKHDSRIRHPSVFGYVEEPPVFGSGAKYTHPSSFGYQFSKNNAENVIPLPSLQEVVSPACVGYYMAAKCHGHIRNSSMVMSPLFFGYNLEKGPRYIEGKCQNKKLAVKLEAIAKLILNPKRRQEKVCRICFGKRLPGCPSCWRPAPESPEMNRLGKVTVEGLKKTKRINSKRKEVQQPQKDNTTSDKTRKNYQYGDTSHIPLTSWKNISLYRDQQASLITFYIKPLPVGDVVRVTIDNIKPIHYLYFLFRANCVTEVANQKKMFILIPTTKGIICLDDDRVKEDELNLAFCPGNRTFADFKITERRCEISAVQVSDLQHPNVTDLMRGFVKQNVNMMKTTEETDPLGEFIPPVLREEHPRLDKTAAMRRRLNRFGFGPGNKTSVSIKSRVESFKGKEARVEELSILSSEKHKDALLLLNNVVDLLDFQVYHRPDKAPDNVSHDALQKLLVHEMKDMLQIQEQAWQQKLKQRKTRIKEMLKKRLEDKLEQRKEKRKKEKEELKSKGLKHSVIKEKVVVAPLNLAKVNLL